MRGRMRRASAGASRVPVLALGVVLAGAVVGCAHSGSHATRQSTVTTARATATAPAQATAPIHRKRLRTAGGRRHPSRARGSHRPVPIAGRPRRIRRGPNRGLYRVRLPDGLILTTHGPDPRPKEPANHGGDIGPGDPERPVACASDHYVHVLYGRPAGAPDRYAAVKAMIQASMRRSDAVLNEDSLQAGGVSADYKVICEAGGQPRVDSFVNDAPFGFGNIVAAARAAGFKDSSTKYVVFYDQNDPSGKACGQGSLAGDESPSIGNSSNDGNRYAIAYGESCWQGATAMHEIGHTMGAVQYNSPNSTGSGGHCRDENDVMCYAPDGGDRNTGTYSRCTDFEHFDCAHD